MLRNSPKPKGTQGRWWIAVLATLVLHVLVVLGLWKSEILLPAEVEALDSPPLELVFAPNEASEEPTFFSEQPPELETEAPESPDFLSNIDSQARDQADGGDPSTTLPNMTGDSEAPQIALNPGGEPSNPNPEETAASPSEEEFPEAEEIEVEDGAAMVQEPVQELDPMTGIRREPSLANPGGNFDFYQPEMDNRTGNVDLTGDISLNTTAWDFAPWLQKFRRDFLRDWHGPPAYYMGIIDGWNKVRLEVDKDGTLLSINVLEEHGHNSLTNTSVLSFKVLAPYQPLPDDFPEDTLILTISLIYPNVKRR